MRVMNPPDNIKNILILKLLKMPGTKIKQDKSIPITELNGLNEFISKKEKFLESWGPIMCLILPSVAAISWGGNGTPRARICL
jgi:hypothetical protein